jgi:drug/metabolite transporter (DMT)-like permease
MKEFFRKKMVGLKRKPQTIALVVLVVAFLYYSLNLTQISNTTAKVQGPGMGLSGFVTMLFSMLSLVCFMNAFPHRKKVNIPMLVLIFIMIGVIIYCDIYYGGRITNAITRADNPIDPTGANSYITNAQNMLKVHMIILIIGAGLTALLPVYAPLLKKVNTSIEVAGNDDMGALDLRGED